MDTCLKTRKVNKKRALIHCLRSIVVEDHDILVCVAFYRLVLVYVVWCWSMGSCFQDPMNKIWHVYELCLEVVMRIL